MDSQFAALGLFCSDIREEKANTLTLVGVQLDNFYADTFPVTVPSLHVYIRRPIDPTGRDVPPAVFLSMPDGEEIALGEITSELLKSTRESSSAKHSPVTFVVTRKSFVPLVVEQPGRMSVIVRGGGSERVCGTLNFMLRSPAAASSSPAAAKKTKKKAAS